MEGDGRHLAVLRQGAHRLDGGETVGELRGIDRGEQRRRRFAGVPPVGQAALRIGVDDGDRPGAAALGLDGRWPVMVLLPAPPFGDATTIVRMPGRRPQGAIRQA